MFCSDKTVAKALLASLIGFGSSLKLLPLACGLGKHFQDFGHNADFPAEKKKKKISISTIIQVKENCDKTSKIIKGMKIVKHVNSTTQQLPPEQLLYFHRPFSLSLGESNLSVSDGLSGNLSLDLANMCQFKRFLADHSLISPEKKNHTN